MENSVDPDQMPHSAATDLGLHSCKDLSVPILRVIMVVKQESLLLHVTCHLRDENVRLSSLDLKINQGVK